MTSVVTRRRQRRAIAGPPGMAGWTGLPERDRRLVEWLWTGDVVTAEVASLLAYGNLRVAQRRLARLSEYDILRGFWSANSQRPRGRYGYALTKPARRELTSLLWGDQPPEPEPGQVEAPSPVIHQLATHDLLAAFLRASPLTEDIGLAAWVPERGAALPFNGVLRPDAIAAIGRGDEATILIVERDLGTERHEILNRKLELYHRILPKGKAVNLGFVVDSPRRGMGLRASLRVVLERFERWDPDVSLGCWVAVSADLLTDPFGASWRSPDGRQADVLRMPPTILEARLPLLSVPALLDEEAAAALDDRALPALGWKPRQRF